MHSVVLDGGTNRLQGLDKLVRSYRVDESWIIYSFDANPQLFRDPAVSTRMKLFSRCLNATFLNVALGNRDGTARFSFSEELDETGSTCDWFSHHNKSYEVTQIDFSRFLFSSCAESDFVVCKLDIEGAEFQVLEHLQRTEAIDLIDELHVEWHADNRWGHEFPIRFSDEDRERYRRIRKEIESSPKPAFFEWY